MTNEVTQAEQAAWHAGLDEGREQGRKEMAALLGYVESTPCADSGDAVIKDIASGPSPAIQAIINMTRGDEKLPWLGAVPDEREAYIHWLTSNHPTVYDEQDATHWWLHGHVSALAWQARAALAATTEADFNAGNSGNKAPVLPEPERFMDDRGYTVEAEWLKSDEATSDYRNVYTQPLYTEQQVRALATGGQAQAVLTGELIEAVDAWFARNTGLGGCSDKDVAELAAIFTAPQAQADARDAWPSIESAPKDGTWIQLWRTPEPEESPVNSTPLVIGRWSDEEESFVWPDDQFYDPFTEHGKAKADQMVEAMQTYASNKFTHWAPLSMPSVHRAAIAAAKGD